MAREKALLARGRKAIEEASKDELVAILHKLVSSVEEINATCNRHSLDAWVMLSKCGCCGAQEWSHNRTPPHLAGCPIAKAMEYCRSGFKE